MILDDIVKHVFILEELLLVLVYLEVDYWENASVLHIVIELADSNGFYKPEYFKLVVNKSE